MVVNDLAVKKVNGQGHTARKCPTKMSWSS